MALALYRKYRPRTFAEVIGQEHVTEPLSQALRSGRLNHAYLFSGPRGCGKTSSARILARSLNCERGPTPEPCGQCDSCRSLATDGAGSIDVIEIDAASHGGVDDARELREKAFFAPASSRYKIYVIDEAHMVSPAGFNALLKLVEEPPDYVKFIFATTEPEKVLGTIRSRTHHYPFRLIPPGVLRPYLEQLCQAEEVTVEPSVFPLVVRAGGGSARDSLSLLDQLIAGAGPEGVSYARAVALLGVTDAALIDEMCDALAAGDGGAAYATVDRVAEAGHDPRRFAADLLERLRDLIVLQQVPDAVSKGLIDGPADQIERMAAQATRLGPATLSRCADIVHNGLVEMRGTTAPRLLLELVTARMLLPGAEDSTGALLQRLERMERRLTLTGGDVAPATAGPAAGSEAGVRPAPVPVAPQVHATPPSPNGPDDTGRLRPGAGDDVAPRPAAATASTVRTDPTVAAGSAPGPESPRGRSAPGTEVADLRVGAAGSAVRVTADTGAGVPPATGTAGPGTAPAPGGAAGGASPAPVARQPVPGSVLPDPATVEPARPGAGQPGVLDAAAVRQVWDTEILGLVRRKSPKVAAWAREATVRDVDGQTLVLTFRHAFHARALTNQPEVLVEAIYEVLGGRWQLRCEVVGDVSSPGVATRPVTPVPEARPGDGSSASAARIAAPPAPAGDPAGPSAGAASRPAGGSAGPAGGSRSGGRAAPAGTAGPAGTARPTGTPSRTANGPPMGNGSPIDTGAPVGGGPPAGNGTPVSQAAPAAHRTAQGDPTPTGGPDWPEPARPGGAGVPADDDWPAPASPGGGPAGGGSATGGAPAQTAAPPRNSAAPRNAAPAARNGGAVGGGLAAARAAAAGAGTPRPPAGAPRPPDSSAWQDGAPDEEPPYDPEYDGPPGGLRGGPAKVYEGFDPGDEPLDDVVDEKTARQSSEQQAMQLLQQAFGAEKIGES